MPSAAEPVIKGAGGGAGKDREGEEGCADADTKGAASEGWDLDDLQPKTRARALHKKARIHALFMAARKQEPNRRRQKKLRESLDKPGHFRAARI